jgi:hypothetical protein
MAGFCHVCDVCATLWESAMVIPSAALCASLGRNSTHLVILRSEATKSDFRTPVESIGLQKPENLLLR